MFLEENDEHSDNRDSRKPERGGDIAERQRKAKITVPGHLQPEGWFPRLPEAASVTFPVDRATTLAPLGPGASVGPIWATLCTLCPLLRLVLLDVTPGAKEVEKLKESQVGIQGKSEVEGNRNRDNMETALFCEGFGDPE